MKNESVTIIKKGPQKRRNQMPIVSSPVPGLEVTDSRFEEQVARAEIVAKIEKYLERFLPHCRTNEDAAISQTLIQTRALLLARRIKE